MFTRRDFLKSAGIAAAGGTMLGGLSACTTTGSASRGHVVIVGGGYGGATTAKYLRMWSKGTVDVTLIERNPAFISCPISNLVIGGIKQMEDITVGYDGLKSKWGVRLITDEVTAVDTAKRTVATARNGTLDYDRLVLSPGIDFIPDAVAGLDGNQERIPHAWKAGPQTVLLRRQLQDMADGGVFALHVPKAPYRCPPGPYERACVVADYLRRAKPRSKVLVLDANAEIQSKKALFTKAFESYGSLIEYVPNSELRGVDVATLTAELEFDSVKADVLNVIPPMRAGSIAIEAGLPLINGRWVDIDWLTMGAKGVPGVHVLGDALFPAPTMPKSGHMANQHGKVAAAAILNLFEGIAPNPAPVVMNTCYSFVDGTNVIHVASVHQYDAEKRQPMPVQGAGGVSAAASEIEGKAALAWARNIWADMLA
ncbi:NAD(P)/FAD-dependent oxidoreductase [Thauera linaloolentis]|uniref:Sulfide dehydrogenase, flavoprtein subunit n=1 Tax=Thauera linaloolentis (strain DSM 12138 / JCM 21573 / CCUG 41526 / CIP 105981 / IAM 15112 / NBRC 102519 / 47Lol) TaxID=1123367 RepID=N6Y5J7_THAL4|nr:NAD(P)/FAD-dependent oxidoreductase [Thauera linaloolentis]ENO89466.1 sulfide dehydrogenase, flavoprtein subunit [Thauera linaloolentis 47Lol = DSM 12138]MCM8566897.1 FCSD flavin-binding domain-containing protein [Thauera linaloolentis]